MKASDNSMRSFTELDDLISDNRGKRRKARETALAIGLPAITKIVELFSRASRPGKVNLLVTLRNIVRKVVPTGPPDDYDEDPLSPWILSATANFPERDVVIDFLLLAADDPDFSVKRSAVLCLLVIEPYFFARKTSREPHWSFNTDNIVGELDLMNLYYWSAGRGWATPGRSASQFDEWSPDESFSIHNFFAQIIALARGSGPWLYTESESIGGGPKGYGLDLGLEPSQVEIDINNLNKVWGLIDSLAEETDEDDDFRAQFIFLNDISSEMLAEMLDDPEGIHPDILINMAMELSVDEMLVESVIKGIEDGRWRSVLAREYPYEFYWKNQSVHTQAIQALGWMRCDLSTAFLWQIYRDKSGDHPTDRMAAVYALGNHKELSAEFEIDADLIFDAGQSPQENLALREAWPWYADLPEPSPGFWREMWRGCKERHISDPELLYKIGAMLGSMGQHELAFDCLESAREHAKSHPDPSLAAKVTSNLCAVRLLAGKGQDAVKAYVDQLPSLSDAERNNLQALPSPVAVRYKLWLVKDCYYPVDAPQAFSALAETSVRFYAVLLVAELQEAGMLNHELGKMVAEQLMKPTSFSRWLRLLDQLGKTGRHNLPLVRSVWLLFQALGQEQRNQIRFRNNGAHLHPWVVSDANRDAWLRFILSLADEQQGIRGELKLDMPKVYWASRHKQEKSLCLWPLILFEPCPVHENEPVLLVVAELEEDGSPIYAPPPDDAQCRKCYENDPRGHCKQRVSRAQLLQHLGLDVEDIRRIVDGRSKRRRPRC